LFAAGYDPFTTFDFIFTEKITGVSVDGSSSADFLPTGTGLTLVSQNEFKVDVANDDPAYLSTLVIDVTTESVSAVPEPSTWAMLLIGFW
jgi:hypothetical protein